MRVGVAQIKPVKGDIAANIEKHQAAIENASLSLVATLFFPELSLTGYEPKLAEKLATTIDDPRLDVFQSFSDFSHMTIGLGLPIRTEAGIQIGMVFFQAGKPRKTYSKQVLHADELPYFTQGEGQLLVPVYHHRIAPAICYESLQTEHAENARNLGADIYLASVAKSQTGIDKAMVHFPFIARTLGMHVVMTNSVGPGDNFECAGQSAVWSKNGDLLGKLDSRNEGLMIFDTETRRVSKRSLEKIEW
jgi:predicted amidohydrolase